MKIRTMQLVFVVLTLIAGFGIGFGAVARHVPTVLVFVVAFAGALAGVIALERGRP
jgi:hypothetical protein